MNSRGPYKQYFGRPNPQLSTPKRYDRRLKRRRLGIAYIIISTHLLMQYYFLNLAYLVDDLESGMAVDVGDIQEEVESGDLHTIACNSRPRPCYYSMNTLPLLPIPSFPHLLYIRSYLLCPCMCASMQTPLKFYFQLFSHVCMWSRQCK